MDIHHLLVIHLGDIQSKITYLGFKYLIGKGISVNKSRLIIAFACIGALFSGCATVTPETNLPSQKLSASIEKNKTRVIFHNTSNKLLYFDASALIGIKVDGKGIANIHFDQYVQIDLTPGQHSLDLSHFDAVTFRDSYEFTAENEIMYVEVFNGLISTKFKVLPSKPVNFETDFEPVSLIPSEEGNKSKR